MNCNTFNCTSYERLWTLLNAIGLDGMQGVRGSNPLTSTHRKSLFSKSFDVNEMEFG